MNTTKVLLGVVAILLSLNSLGQTVPLASSISVAAQDVLDFVSKKVTIESCSENLRSLNTTLFDIKSNQFADIGNVVEANGNDAVSVLFNARVALNEKLRDFVGGHKDGQRFQSPEKMVDCVDQIRVAHRSIRSLEDRIAMSSLRKQNKLKNLGLVGMPSADLGLKPFTENQWPNLIVNKKLVPSGNLTRDDLKSGDFFMTKGTTFASSVISRIGKIDNQFSHLAVVYIDDGSLFGEKNKGKIYVVESEPDFGLQIVSLDHFLTNDKNRLVLYRYSPVGDLTKLTSPSEVAKRAAKFLAEKADVRPNEYDKTGSDDTMKSRLDVVEKQTGKRFIQRVGYNFGMDMNIESTLFCSQIVSYGLKNACNQPGVKCESFPEIGNDGVNIFPLVQSEIVTKDNGFAKLLNLTIDKTFAPADAEVEPRFEMIAEWRDVSYASYTRLQDMAMTKLFQLMEQGKYEFIESSELKAFADVTTKMLKDAGKMPHDMPEGLTKGSLYTAFLTWYSGPGRMITDVLEKMQPNEILNLMVSISGLQKETAELMLKSIGESQDSPDQQGEKIKNFASRIAKHKSLIGFLQEIEEQNVKDKGFYITEKQMSNVIDVVRKNDCELFKKLSTGQKISNTNKEGAPQRNTLVLHDLVRRKTMDLNQACEISPMPLQNF
jgi:hypothetical protein